MAKIKEVNISEAVRKMLGAQPGLYKLMSPSLSIWKRPTLAPDPQMVFNE